MSMTTPDNELYQNPDDPSISSRIAFVRGDVRTPAIPAGWVNGTLTFTPLNIFVSDNDDIVVPIPQTVPITNGVTIGNAEFQPGQYTVHGNVTDNSGKAYDWDFRADLVPGINDVAELIPVPGTQPPVTRGSQSSLAGRG